jgi:tripartite-type tricarboxylate transporter receptor subunit TctC
MNQNTPFNKPRRQLLGAMAASSFLPAWAQSDYPSKPIRLIVPFAPGGVIDAVARLIADPLSKALGKAVVVENKPGASGNIGSHAVATAEPDGHTLLVGFDGTLVINPHISESMPFKPLSDFSPISRVGDSTLVLLAHPSLGVRNLSELVARSKREPQALAYGTSGTGSTPHIAAEVIAQRLGAKLLHVPYRGGAAALVDVLGNNIPLVFTAIASASQYIATGKLVPLAVASASRFQGLPMVATVAESGIPGYEFNSWVGLLAPANTPAQVISRLNVELAKLLSDTALRKRLSDLGIEAKPGRPGDFYALMQRDYVRYHQVVKSLGLKPTA